MPALDRLPADLADEPTLFDLDGEKGTSNFRVRYLPADGLREASVIALPTDSVRDTMRQLRITFALIAVGLAAILTLAGFWLNRYGLRPIAKMTATADAITGGDRTRRADDPGKATEVGKMAAALNLMLDERDAAEARMRAFVSDASHELRTPLTSISGYLDLYQQGGFREAGQLDDAVRRIQLEAARMNLLVNDLLRLAKLDEEQPLSTDRVDATHARIELEVGGDDDLIDFCVTDDGPGLSPHDAERIFDRFYRGDASRTRTSGGSGLGLAIARSIVEAHGGTLEVRSPPGGGACFCARIPAAGGQQEN